MFIGKMLWEMYFMKLSKKHQHCGSGHGHSSFEKKIKALSTNIQIIDFSYLDKFSHIKKFLCMTFCCKIKVRPKEYLSRSEYLFQKGYD